uniref:Uncharacterized protein n=1 Tax=Cacopsylla melanoneura TaxID=428564 RepID=A0A8D8SW07_9HEMI
MVTDLLYPVVLAGSGGVFLGVVHAEFVVLIVVAGVIAVQPLQGVHLQRKNTIRWQEIVKEYIPWSFGQGAVDGDYFSNDMITRGDAKEMRDEITVLMRDRGKNKAIVDIKALNVCSRIVQDFHPYIKG